MSWASAMLSNLRAFLRRKIKRHWPSFYAARRGLVAYSKPVLTPAALLGKLTTTGLVVANPIAATAYLEEVNYFRFKIYLRPLLAPPSFKSFIPGAAFETACEIYEFDQELRSLVFPLTGSIEVLLRHRIDTRIATHQNNPFWYLDKELYRAYPTRTLDMIRSSTMSSREQFSQHYHGKYHSGAGGPYHLLPPFWIASELLSLGQLMYLLKGLDKTKFNNASPGAVNELDRLAKDFGAYNIHDLVHWVEYLRNLRNWCAHHNRLWNRQMAEPRSVARSLSRVRGGGQTRHRLYHQLAMIRLMLQARAVPDKIKASVSALFLKYPQVELRKSEMGFPNSWQADPFW